MLDEQPSHRLCGGGDVEAAGHTAHPCSDTNRVSTSAQRRPGSWQRGLGRGVDERLDAAARRAEEAEAKLAAAQAEGAARFDEVVDLLRKSGAFDRAGVEALIAALEAEVARRGGRP